MAASIKNTRASAAKAKATKAKATKAKAPSWFNSAVSAAASKKNQRVAKHVGIGAAIGVAGVALYQHFAG